MTDEEIWLQYFCAGLQRLIEVRDAENWANEALAAHKQNWKDGKMVEKND